MLDLVNIFVKSLIGFYDKLVYDFYKNKQKNLVEFFKICINDGVNSHWNINF